MVLSFVRWTWPFFGFHVERNIVKCNEILVMCISADGKIHLRDVTCLVLQMLLFKFWFLFFNTADVTFRFGEFALKWNFLKWNSQTWKWKFLRNLCSNGFIPDAMLMTVFKFTCPICFQVEFSNFMSQRVFNVFFLQFDFHVSIFLKILNVKSNGFDNSFWVWEFTTCFVLRWNSFDFSDFSETANCQILTTFPLKEVFTMKGVPDPIWIAIK